ncbi:MAG: LemA family protein [Gordonia sp. (in: high G+C Gram-positive bacteria)]|uniref:LemA family protein n=1 Tax=Gordonia sp. (in: high G+C Gram-positive bacteria) TaxID=84139 RepID=UPI0039E58897
MKWLLIVGFVVAAAYVVTWPVRAHNALVRMQTVVVESWRGIDIELVRRWDLIPRLADVARAYARHEAHTLLALAEQRSATTLPDDPDSAFRALHDRDVVETAAEQDAELARALGRLQVVAEGTPKLQASKHYAKVRAALTDTEDRIAAARRLYNGNVSRYNARLRAFPTSTIARRAGFAPAEYFELSDDRAD